MTIKNVTEEKEKKKFKSLIVFLGANKIDNYNTEWGGGEKKKCKRIYRTSQKIRIINAFLESLLSEYSPTLGITLHLTSLGCPPMLYWSLDLLWGQLRFLSGPTPVCSCLQGPQLTGLVRFILWELSMTFHTFHRHRGCLGDPVGLVCSLYSW